MKISALLFKLLHRGEEAFLCPVCGYEGPFQSISPSTGNRRSAMCPDCQALERHRLQSLVLDQLFGRSTRHAMRILHVAPEPFFRKRLTSQFDLYQTADIERTDVDHRVDLQSLPFAAESFDIVYASHVLEHVPNDRTAISEIFRILTPAGIAILPVPVVCSSTVEYGAPNPNESMHMRAPGLDYFGRYRRQFPRVSLFSSEDFPTKHQLHVLESREGFPNPSAPLRTPMPGEKHIDVVPVCYKETSSVST